MTLLLVTLLPCIMDCLFDTRLFARGGCGSTCFSRLHSKRLGKNLTCTRSCGIRSKNRGNHPLFTLDLAISLASSSSGPLWFPPTLRLHVFMRSPSMGLTPRMHTPPCRSRTCHSGLCISKPFQTWQRGNPNPLLPVAVFR